MQYDVFLSYSHEDEALAKRLSRRIRSYRPPRNLSNKHNRLEVFRDVERLTASTNLTDELTTRLNASKHLAILCSPSAAHSKYVDREIASFSQANENKENITLLLCRGEPEESIPLRLRIKGQEPLFIDLRRRRAGLAGLMQLRIETLRLMARLLEVDFSELYREDVKRNRRRWLGGIVSAVLLTLFISAQLVVNSVPKQFWSAVTLPKSYRDSPLMPVKHVAINKSKPQNHLYYVLDAKFESGKSGIYSKLISPLSSSEKSEFDKITLKYLKANKAGNPHKKPIALLNFEVEDWDGITGRGIITVYGYIARQSGQPRYLRSLKFLAKNIEGQERELFLDRMSNSETDSPFDLYPWPIDSIREEGLLWLNYGRIKGTIINHLSGARIEVVYQLTDAWDAIDEACDGLCFNEAILTNQERQTIVLDGLTVNLTEVDHPRKTWQKVVNSPEWSTYRKPEIKEYLLNPYLDPDRKFRVSDMEKGNGAAESLAPALDEILENRRLKNIYDDRLTVKIIARKKENRQLLIATILSESGGMGEAYQVEKKESFHLFRSEPGTEWRELSLPQKIPGNIITDVIVVGGKKEEVIVVTDKDGLFCSTGDMDRWIDCNFGESRLLRGDRVKIITAAHGNAVYALSDNYVGQGRAVSGENELFLRYRRSWIERLNMGLK